ncbi:MAG: glycosyltransferase family 4 protein [Pseudodonghicola sp.]
MTRPRVLVIAEAANPEWASVPLIGWSLTAALRGVADVHLVTHLRNRDAILRAGWIEGQDFTAIDSDLVMRPLWKLAERLRMGEGKGWTVLQALSSLGYPYFEHLLWKQFGPAIRAGDYDIVHRVTPLSPTSNSPIAAKCARAGVPFVLGPLNGGVPWPKGFDRERRQEREFLSYVRGLYKLRPGRMRMLKASRAILTGSRHTGSEIPARFQDRCIHIPENAVDPARFTKRAAQDIAPPLRGCFLGRLVPYKGPDMLIEAAVPLLQSGALVLDIVGAGPMEAELRARAAQAGVAEKITFHGWLPHDRVQDVLAQANLLTFPSIREFGGGVVLEAMALGVVPLICDYAGPAELVTPGTGFKLPMGAREQIVAALRAQLETLAQDPSALPAMGAAARAQVENHYTWARKAEQIARVYDWVLRPEEPTPQLLPTP